MPQRVICTSGRLETRRTSQHGGRSRVACAVRGQLRGPCECIGDDGAISGTIILGLYDHTQVRSKTKTCKDDIGWAHDMLKALKVACPKLAIKQFASPAGVGHPLQAFPGRTEVAVGAEGPSEDLPQWLAMMTNRIKPRTRSAAGRAAKPDGALGLKSALEPSKHGEILSRTARPDGVDLRVCHGTEASVAPPGQPPRSRRSQEHKKRSTTSKCSRRATSWSPLGRTRRGG